MLFERRDYFHQIVHQSHSKRIPRYDKHLSYQIVQVLVLLLLLLMALALVLVVDLQKHHALVLVSLMALVEDVKVTVKVVV